MGAGIGDEARFYSLGYGLKPDPRKRALGVLEKEACNGL